MFGLRCLVAAVAVGLLEPGTADRIGRGNRLNDYDYLMVNFAFAITADSAARSTPECELPGQLEHYCFDSIKLEENAWDYDLEEINS